MMLIKRLASVVMVAAISLGGVSNAEARLKIGMVVWLGCEDVCRGVQDAIVAHGLDADFVVMDAAQDKAKLPLFVQQARREKMDLVLTWGTTTTLGIVGTLADKDDRRFLNDIPVVFTVVADPVGSKIAGAAPT